MLVRRSVLLDGRLNQRRIVRSETLQTLERLQRVALERCIFGQARLDGGTRLRLVAAVARQLAQQVVLIEAGLIVEQAHLAEDAVNVVTRLFVVLKVPRLVLVQLLFGDGELGDALRAILEQIIVRLHRPVVGDDLFVRRLCC